MSIPSVSSEPASLLRQAIEAGNATQALSVLQAGNSCPDLEGGCTNLIRAIKYFENSPAALNVIKLLIDKSKIEIINFCPQDSADNAMLLAAQKANAAVIDFLAQAGASVDGTGIGAGAPLYRVAVFAPNALWMKGNTRAVANQRTLDSVRVLLEHGASIDLLQSNKCSLLPAYIKNAQDVDPNLVTLLVEEGASLLSEEEVQKLPPAHAPIISAAIEAGLQIIADRKAIRDAVTTELKVRFPAPLLETIRSYIH